MFDIHGVFLYINHMTKFKNKKLKKLYLKGFKAARSKRPTQDEYDLMMTKKIKEYSKDNKINVEYSNFFMIALIIMLRAMMSKNFILFLHTIQLIDIFITT